MKKIIILSFFMFGFWSINAQNQLMSKEMERHYLQAVRPVTHQFDQLRNPNLNALLSENFDSASLPTGWTTVDNMGNGNWTFVNDYNGNTLDGTPFAMIDSDSYGQADLDAELTSPEVDVSALNSVFISFDQYFNAYDGDSLTEVGDVDVFDGTQWVNVYSVTSDTGAWGNPDHQIIDVTAYKNANFKVRFHYYNANYEWYWAIDNVMIFEPDADDLATINIMPETFLPNLPFSLNATVYNNGSNTQDNFDVVFNITDSSSNSVFTETVNVTGANLTPGGSYVVTTTTQATLPVGTYTAEAAVVLTGDSNSANDTKSEQLYIIDYPSTYTLDNVYTYITTDMDSSGDDNNLATFDINSGAITPIGPLTSNDFFTSGTFINDVLVAVEYGTNAVYLIDGNGATHKFGYFHGDIGNNSITAIAYDSALQTGYLTNGNVLLTFDSSLNTTLIGPMNNAGLMIGMDVDNNGNLYGIDMQDDQLYSIDATSGAATAIGALGINIRYAQDMGADPTTGNLYGTLFQYDQTSGSTSGLYAIDKLTGAATVIGTEGVDEYTICAIKGTTVSVSENHIAGLKVYPNPANGMISISAHENIQNISIVNLTGQEVKNFDNDGVTAQLDISDLPSGSYILKITTGQTTGTYQIIKK